jgi:SAM-dependent methyltransferase
MITKHLDLGCGYAPRNPYDRDEIWGIDISQEVLQLSGKIKHADLSFEKIPFEDNNFDSVSAYDFLEHIPRVLASSKEERIRFPFIELMNEIWRVLKRGGLLYAVTPAYPRQEVFVDPTHVNIITEKTHIYFTEPLLMAKAYGFDGSFKVLRAEWMRPMYDWEPDKPTISHRFKRIKNRIKRRNTHFLWELEAIKP